jgi:hypothetical protein
MQNRISDLFDQLENYKRAYRQPLAPEIIERISEVCDGYTSESNDGRTGIRSRVSLHTSKLFLGFARVRSEESVQQHSQALLRQGLVGLAIEDCFFDWRDSTIALSLQFHSATKLGMDVPRTFHEIESISGPQMAKLLRDFPARKPQLQALEVFGWAEGTNAEGLFAYVSNIPH